MRHGSPSVHPELVATTNHTVRRHPVVVAEGSLIAVETAFAVVQDTPIPGYAYPFAEAIGPAVRQAMEEPGDLLEHAIRVNVVLGVEGLRTVEPTLAPLIAGDTVTIAGAIYDLASGAVTFLV